MVSSPKCFKDEYSVSHFSSLSLNLNMQALYLFIGRQWVYIYGFFNGAVKLQASYTMNRPKATRSIHKLRYLYRAIENALLNT